ncbi:unnamed protein product [Toxocara canis]|uniref:Peptidase_M24 domain-containing protein n=1 Tax=Toxocara canis TaxID=6265 RepID=A0A183TZZ2_TOXCA|nr:unnamed protein product [Toxocara canis]
MLDELLNIECYHGMVPREEVERILVNDGEPIHRDGTVLSYPVQRPSYYVMHKDVQVTSSFFFS